MATPQSRQQTVGAVLIGLNLHPTYYHDTLCDTLPGEWKSGDEGKEGEGGRIPAHDIAEEGEDRIERPVLTRARQGRAKGGWMEHVGEKPTLE